MELTKLTVDEFTELLGSEAPAPGGGSASALAGALGAALTCMVANLTVTKAKYAEYHELANDTLKKTSALQHELTLAIDRDTEAFNMIGAAFALPKTNDEEITLRANAIQDALIACTESPLHIMELADEALVLTDTLVGNSNVSAASDLGVSALFLKVALLGGWLNVLINIGSIKDTEKAAAYKAKGEALLERSLPLADRIYQTIESSL